MNILTQGARRPLHIDTLEVRHGFAFIVDAIETIVLGGGRRDRDVEIQSETDAFALCTAGRGA